jgi:hypothetical protein
VHCGDDEKKWKKILGKISEHYVSCRKCNVTDNNRTNRLNKIYKSTELINGINKKCFKAYLIARAYSSSKKNEYVKMYWGDAYDYEDVFLIEYKK